MPNTPLSPPPKALRRAGSKRSIKHEQAIDLPDPPPFVTGYAADEWWNTVTELHGLNLLIKIDRSVLATYCHAFGQWKMAVETLADVADDNPGARILLTKPDGLRSQLVNIARQHAAEMVRYANELGLTAVARSRLAAVTNVPPLHRKSR